MKMFPPFILKLSLLGWHWLMKLYWFQVYNSVIYYPYIASCTHHPKSDLLAPPLPITTLPTLSDGNRHTIVCVLWVFVCFSSLFFFTLGFIPHIGMKSYGSWHFLSDLFCLARYSHPCCCKEENVILMENKKSPKGRNPTKRPQTILNMNEP